MNPGAGGAVVAVIPARGGSKGIPGKNLEPVGGISLVGRAVRACRAVPAIDVVAVSTDDEAIAAEAARHGAVTIERPATLATDQASSESALVHALEELDRMGHSVRVLVFVQCTSPFISPGPLAEAVARVSDGGDDSVFSAVPSHAFVWTRDGAGRAVGVNHDASVRLRRQDRAPEWRETGAFYVMDAAGFAAAGHRFFGRVGIQEVAEAEAMEIDTPADLSLARALDATVAAPAPAGLDRVRVLVTDFDGVHTDDRATVTSEGVESVTVNRSDGHGVKLLREAGLTVLILSTEKNPVVARRAEKLGVEVIHGLDDKAAELRRWLAAAAIDPADAAYLGNDVNDLGCLELVGFPMCVADAHPRVRDLCVFTTARVGGSGAVREVAELLIAARAGSR